MKYKPIIKLVKEKIKEAQKIMQIKDSIIQEKEYNKWRNFIVTELYRNLLDDINSAVEFQNFDQNYIKNNSNDLTVHINSKISKLKNTLDSLKVKQKQRKKPYITPIIVFVLVIIVIIIIKYKNITEIGFKDIYIKFSPQNKNKAKKVNFYYIFQKKLDIIFYSYYTLRALPVFPEKNNKVELIFENRVFQLKRFRLKINNHFYLFYPSTRNTHRPFNKISFFIIEHLSIDKSSLHQVFQKPEELKLVFKIIEDYEYAVKAFKIFWSNTPEGDPYKVNLELDKTKLSVSNLDLVKVRWHKTEQIFKYVSKIEKNIELLRKNFDSPLEIKKFTGEHISTIKKFKYKFK